MTYLKNNSNDMENITPIIQKESEEQAILNALLLVAPLIQKIMPMDCMIGIVENTHFKQIYFGNKIKMDLNPAGLGVPKEDAIYQAMLNDEVVSMIVPKEAFGFEFKALALPLKNSNNKIFGGLGIGFDLENSIKVKDMSEQVATSSEHISSVMEELASSAMELSEFQVSLKLHAEAVTEKIEETTQILQFINSIASTSNMLGLNAAIEASRAGELGRGFSVVAAEIRKMAEESAKSVQHIRYIFESISAAMKEINIDIERTVSIGQQQAAATEEITASSQDLAIVSVDLKQAAQNVIG